MEKYCKNCGRVFKDSDFKICPYCGNQLSTRVGRQPIPRKLRHQVFQRDNYRCRECGATNKQTRLHVDHIVPVAKGGTNDLSNLQTLCEACNRAKYTDEWVGGSYNNDNNHFKRNDKPNPEIKWSLGNKMEFVLMYFESTHSLEKAAVLNNIDEYEVLNWYNQGKMGNKYFVDFYEEVEWMKSHNYNRRNIDFALDTSLKVNQHANLIINPKNNFNDKLNKIIEEFKKCNDINVVSMKVDVSPYDIKKWYESGKKGNLVYEDLYNELSKLPPNMSIKKSNIEKKNEKSTNSKKNKYHNSDLSDINSDEYCKSGFKNGNPPNNDELYEMNSLQRQINLDNYNKQLRKEELKKEEQLREEELKREEELDDILIEIYGTRKCPNCGKDVLNCALRCKYCKYSFKKDNNFNNNAKSFIKRIFGL